MFAITRSSFNYQVNSRPEKDLTVFETLEFFEIAITLGNKTLKGGWRTKKFYDSRVVATWQDLAVAKAYRYANKLDQGTWLAVDEYDALYGSIQKIESSPRYHAYLVARYGAPMVCAELCPGVSNKDLLERGDLQHWHFITAHENPYVSYQMGTEEDSAAMVERLG